MRRYRERTLIRIAAINPRDRTAVPSAQSGGQGHEVLRGFVGGLDDSFLLIPPFLPRALISLERRDEIAARIYFRRTPLSAALHCTARAVHTHGAFTCSRTRGCNACARVRGDAPRKNNLLLVCGGTAILFLRRDRRHKRSSLRGMYRVSFTARLPPSRRINIYFHTVSVLSS